MKKKRIAPPLVMIAFLILAWLISNVLTHYSVGFRFQHEIALASILVGLAIAISGVARFSAAKTTVNPLNLKKSSALVTGGIYRITRNPMYLGMVFVILSVPLWTGSLLSLIAPIGFVLYMTERQIKPEEEALTTLFGEDYQAYESRVRRWL